MKKGLIIIAAALFVAAMVLPAMAVDMSLSGFYRVRGFYQSNGDSDDVSGGATTHRVTATDNVGSPDAYWDHMLQLNPVFKVADNLKLVTRVSMFNNQMWGSSQTTGVVAGKDALSANHFNDTAENIIFNRAYIEWATPKGTLKIGRMAGNYTFFLPFGNTELDADRIVYASPNYDGFNVVLGHEKRVEGSVTDGYNHADADHDRYFAILSYACPGLYVGYAPDWYRDETYASTSATASINKYNHNFCLKLNDPTNTYFFEGELQLRKGEKDNDTGLDYDYDGMGYYAAAGMRKGPLTVAIATAFCSGDDNGSDTDYKAGTPLGLDFQPLYILTGDKSNIATNSEGGYGYYLQNAGGMTYGTDQTLTGVQAYLICADYVVDPQLTVHGALGMAYADKTMATYDDEIGTELDLGLKYQIMSNLAYELHAGYLWTGDLFKGAGATTAVDNMYQIDHSLTLSF
ncbi:MAG: hypothetical protein D4R73_02375 [Deltaproteobacteria bacterium]|nr:MAG: hypothetical protein D4R73_02375 [Deltaproteobacteria bacterium]